jgi:high-affinity iron transporter
MFAAALIVFRETLEAALFIGIIAAATRHLPGRMAWLTSGVVAGLAGALALAAGAEQISAWQDGIGQDVLNVIILSVALAMLLWHCIWVSTHGKDMAAEAQQLGTSVGEGTRRPWALLVAVALAVLREGAETVLFISGSLAGAETPVSRSSVLLVSAGGLAAGAAVGAAVCLGLSRIPAHRLFTITNALIAVLAASIASQLAKALAQVGWLTFGDTPLWDSSQVLSQDGPVGTLLHALVGYDANPSALQLVCYVGALLLIFFGTRWARAEPLRKVGISPAA